MADEEERKSLLVKKHHEKTESCYSRPKYRDPRWEKAVKVYTINMESRNILVHGVPSVGVSKELMDNFSSYGSIQLFKKLEEYPTEEFTEVYQIKYERINNARYAKRKMDNKSFYGGVLHICYAPEFESVDETREKLKERWKVITKKMRELPGNLLNENRVSTQLQPKTVPLSSVSDSPFDSSPSIPSTESTLHSSSTSTLSARTSEEAYYTTNQTHDYFCEPNRSYPEFPQIPPPPLPLHPSQYPPPPPPWELPRVPSANATLSSDLQKMSDITVKTFNQCHDEVLSVDQQCEVNMKFSQHGCVKDRPEVTQYSLKSVEGSVERTVKSIREKMKRASVDSSVQGSQREDVAKRNGSDQPRSKRTRKRI